MNTVAEKLIFNLVWDVCSTAGLFMYTAGILMMFTPLK